MPAIPVSYTAQFVTVMFSNAPVESVPSFTALHSELMVQLATTTFRQPRREVLFRHTASSPHQISQFAMRTFEQSSMSMPSLLEFTRLATEMPSINTFVAGQIVLHPHRRIAQRDVLDPNVAALAEPQQQRPVALRHVRACGTPDCVPARQ